MCICRKGRAQQVKRNENCPLRIETLPPHFLGFCALPGRTKTLLIGSALRSFPVRGISIFILISDRSPTSCLLALLPFRNETVLLPLLRGR